MQSHGADTSVGELRVILSASADPAIQYPVGRFRSRNARYPGIDRGCGFKKQEKGGAA